MPTEQQHTSISNHYYDLVSVLYHTLQASQTFATYVQDAQQTGDQELVQFFQQIHRQETQWAEKARELLAKQLTMSHAR